jgi:hypothetical protein
MHEEARKHACTHFPATAKELKGSLLAFLIIKKGEKFSMSIENVCTFIYAKGLFLF